MGALEWHAQLKGVLIRLHVHQPVFLAGDRHAQLADLDPYSLSPACSDGHGVSQAIDPFCVPLEGDDRVVLSVRPGITGPATLKYRDEETILAEQADPERYNDDVIFPDKVRINRDYVLNYRFRDDLLYIWRTLTGDRG